MCGIFGIFKNHEINSSDKAYARDAAEMMHHRGPDYTGYFSDENCMLCHKRLSIIDLSEQANQPMKSRCGRYVIIYNGELYNYPEIRDELIKKGIGFKTRSDTEVVLNALIFWGIGALKKFNGMFALCLYDMLENKTYLARDHVGMKPLYYSYQNDILVFGSQYDQIVKYPEFHKHEIDYQSLTLYLSFGYFSHPGTLFKNIHALKPGTCLVFSTEEREKKETFFDIDGMDFPDDKEIPSDEDLLASFDCAVRRHMISDVKLGTFLSGGLDSPIVTYLTRKYSDSGLDAFTVANYGTDNDESGQAAQYGKRLSLRHHLIDSRKPDIFSTLKSYTEAYSEPFGDYSGLPSVLVAEAAKERGIKVLLTGDGADELFFGYTRIASRMKASAYYYLPQIIRRIINRFYRIPSVTMKNLRDMTRFMEQGWADENILPYYKRDFEVFADYFYPKKVKVSEYDIWLKKIFLKRYFQCMVNKIDRATMLHSVEARIPFMDKEFLKVALRYRAKDCYDDGFRNYKKPLRNIHRKLYPAIEPQDRKMGFGIPLADWLQSDINAWAINLARKETDITQVINFEPLCKDLENRSIKHPVFAWSILYLQIWYLRYMENRDYDEIFEL
jgi:asparagine synthase (glutamine-hydrolysing)